VATAAPGQPAKWQGPLPPEAARLFTAAKTHQERLALIANPTRDGDLMERFFRDGPGAGERVKELVSMGPASAESVTFERFQVNLENGGARLLCVILTELEGKIDFRSYARQLSESWADLLGGKASEAEEVRIFISSGSAYFQSFVDEQAWSSYIAVSPDLEDPLYFYAKRHSAVDQRFAEIIGGGEIRATLAIRAVGDSFRHRQFEITDLHTAGWVR
jgi:hypothetical protein